jgi:uncharacterized membrane protein YdbT with pleckstrin-like domain
VLSTPEDVVRSYLVSGERIIHEDRPALDAFFVIWAREVILAFIFFCIVVWAFATGRSTAIILLAFVAFDIVIAWLVVRRLQAVYTRYVITTFRVLRTSGVLTRKNEWIPWVKITDLSFRQTMLGRLFGYATIRIESANEESGLKDLSDLKDPVRFNRILVEMINAKQGFVAPMATFD